MTDEDRAFISNGEWKELKTDHYQVRDKVQKFSTIAALFSFLSAGMGGIVLCLLSTLISSVAANIHDKARDETRIETLEGSRFTRQDAMILDEQAGVRTEERAEERIREWADTRFVARSF